MLELLPTEYWDYRFVDMIRGVLKALESPDPDAESEILIPGLGPCLPVRSGRAGIFLALKSLALPPGARIGVPLYCCPVVFKTIKAAGYSVCFIDIDPATYCLSADDLAAKSSDVDAVVPVHMFGNSCDVNALRRAAPGKPFIEDCAQALGSRINCRMVGSFGDLAVFSFRSGKYLSVGEGGAVYCTDNTLTDRLSKLNGALGSPSRVDECVHVGTTYLRSLLRSRPLWGLIGTQLWDVYNANTSYASKSRLILQQIYKTDRHTILQRLPLLSSWIEKQRSNARYYEQNLCVNAEMLCSEMPEAFFNRLQYPLLLPTSEQCDELATSLRKNQISTARPYKDIAVIAATHYGYNGDCPQAERIARTVLVIPCNHALTAGQIERVTSCVNRAWARVGIRRASVRESSIPAAT